MRRVTVPIIFTIAAVLLLAGAFGDLPTWRNDAIPKILEAAKTDSPAPPRTRPEPDASGNSSREAQKREAQDLRAQIAQSTRDLAALRASTEQARQELASVRQRRDQEQSALTQAEAQHHAAEVQSQAASSAVSPAPVGRAGEALPLSTVASAPGPAPSNPPHGPVVAPTGSPAVAPAAGPVAAPAAGLVVAQLTQARAALSSGRRYQARRHLRYLRNQMARLPHSSDKPGADGAGAVRGQVEYAIALLDRGDQSRAMQSIDQALAVASGETAASPSHDGKQDGKR